MRGLIRFCALAALIPSLLCLTAYAAVQTRESTVGITFVDSTVAPPGDGKPGDRRPGDDKNLMDLPDDNVQILNPGIPLDNLGPLPETGGGKQNPDTAVAWIDCVDGCTRVLRGLSLWPVDIKLNEHLFGEFLSFLRCRRSEYKEYSFLLRLEMPGNFLKNLIISIYVNTA